MLGRLEEGDRKGIQKNDGQTVCGPEISLLVSDSKFVLWRLEIGVALDDWHDDALQHSVLEVIDFVLVRKIFIKRATFLSDDLSRLLQFSPVLHEQAPIGGFV